MVGYVKNILKIVLLFLTLSLLNFLLLSFYSTTFDIKLWNEGTRVMFIFGELAVLWFSVVLVLGI